MSRHVARANAAVSALRPLAAELAASAQAIYDAWSQDADGVDDEHGAGGICDAVADAMGGVVGKRLSDAEVDRGGHDGDDHAWLTVTIGHDVALVDIPPGVYERGGGYRWTKIPDVTIRPEDVVIEPIRRDPDAGAATRADDTAPATDGPMAAVDAAIRGRDHAALADIIHGIHGGRFDGLQGDRGRLDAIVGAIADAIAADPSDGMLRAWDFPAADIRTSNLGGASAGMPAGSWCDVRGWISVGVDDLIDGDDGPYALPSWRRLEDATWMGDVAAATRVGRPDPDRLCAPCREMLAVMGDGRLTADRMREILAPASDPDRAMDILVADAVADITASCADGIPLSGPIEVARAAWACGLRDPPRDHGFADGVARMAVDRWRDAAAMAVIGDLAGRHPRLARDIVLRMVGSESVPSSGPEDDPRHRRHDRILLAATAAGLAASDAAPILVHTLEDALEADGPGQPHPRTGAWIARRVSDLHPDHRRRVVGIIAADPGAFGDDGMWVLAALGASS